jgi:hypothetical protein
MAHEVGRQETGEPRRRGAVRRGLSGFGRRVFARLIVCGLGQGDLVRQAEHAGQAL